jgi:hypothetical protein
MGYRDDLEAALERAETLERDLARANSEVTVDEERIAELERQLKEARANLPKETPQKPARSRAPYLAAGVLGVLALGVVFAVLQSSSAPPKTSNGPPPKLTPPLPAPKLDPHDVPVSSSLPAALALAQRSFSDAQLSRLNADYVSPLGIAQLKYGGEVRFRFVSPSHAEQPPAQAPILGAPALQDHVDCRVSVYADQNNKELRPGSTYSDNCTDPLPPSSPRCSVEAIWQRALAKGAPSEALATLELRLRSGEAQWKFQIVDQARNQTVISLSFPDDCP